MLHGVGDAATQFDARHDLTKRGLTDGRTYLSQVLRAGTRQLFQSVNKAGGNLLAGLQGGLARSSTTDKNGQQFRRPQLGRAVLQEPFAWTLTLGRVGHGRAENPFVQPIRQRKLTALLLPTVGFLGWFRFADHPTGISQLPQHPGHEGGLFVSA